MTLWGIVAAFLGTWLGLLSMQFLMLLFALLRMPIWPVRIKPLTTLPILSAVQQAALDELRALGFEVVQVYDTERGPLRFPGLVCQHSHDQALALIDFLADPYTAYPVSFVSLATSGRLLVTVNRRACLSLPSVADVELADPYVDSLAAHWLAHQERVREQALAPLTAEALFQRWCDDHIRTFDGWCTRGLIRQSAVGGQLGLRAALRLSRAIWRVRRQLNSPYRSVVTDTEHYDAFALARFELQETLRGQRPPRPLLKAVVLFGSLLLALSAWGLSWNWQTALILTVVLLVHELGHALAMMAFGYRDLNMFFVPFLGAMVTGRPGQCTAWQQAVMLLAGPVPGLLWGMWVLHGDGALLLPAWWSVEIWRQAGLLAVTVNLFNLLPISPLDGGQLIELALFGRWPRLRVFFAGLSAAALGGLAWWWQSSLLAVIAIVLLVAMRFHWRVARLQGALAEVGDESSRRTAAFAASRRMFGAQSFGNEVALIQAVETRRQWARVRRWEMALVLVVFVGIWAAPAWALYQQGWRAMSPGQQVKPSEPDYRSAAQRAFDAAYEAFEEARYADSEDEPAVPVAAALDVLRKHTEALAVNDGRRVDLLVAVARSASEAEQAALWLAALTPQRDGVHNDLTSIADEYLGDLHRRLDKTAAHLRRQQLQQALNAIDAVAPKAYRGTIAARMWLAEAMDLSGDRSAAEALMASVRARVDNDESCRCELDDVVRAQSNYYLSHRETSRALRLFADPSLQHWIQPPGGRLKADYAWALLDAGRPLAGLEHMQTAFQREHQDAWSWWRNPREELSSLERWTLAYAHMAAGELNAAKSWMQPVNDEPGLCADTWRFWLDFREGPWQERRRQALSETKNRLCGREAG